MNKRFSLLAGLTALLAMGTAGATLPPPPPVCPEHPVASEVNPETGHYFEIYSSTGVGWNDANTCAMGKTYSGVPGVPAVNGHLATITSSSEDAWVEALRVNNSGLGQVWVGGSQQNPGTDEPGGGWGWVNNEGPFPGNNDGPAYANWNSAEPNNSGNVESHLTVGRYGVGGGWNDEGVAPGSIAGFIVEYDVPRPAECEGTECKTINGQLLTIPPEWINSETDTIKFSSYEFTDPRVAAGTCGTAPLHLFEYLGADKTLHIPRYLCGSPKFVVVAVDGRDLDFTTGTVLIENDTATVLPGNKTPANAVPANAAYVCKDTKAGSTNPVYPLVAGEDPQYQDVVVYQTTDPGRMLEDQTEIDGQLAQFAGAASEVTNGCGSSRGTGKETSYFVVGMHVDFGTMGATAAGSHDRFVALTRYKLTLLQQSVAAARSAGALRPGTSVIMEGLVALAIRRLDRGDPVGARFLVDQFVNLVNAVRYTPVATNNFNGEHLMRGTNIEYTLRVKVIPYGR